MVTYEKAIIPVNNISDVKIENNNVQINAHPKCFK